MADLPELNYEHDGVALTGRLARPSQGGMRPGILVMHDAIGLGSLVQKRAAELAGMGYVALCTDMYGPEIHSGDPEAHGKLFMALQGEPARLRERVVKGYEALRALPDVDPTRIAAIGYCFGGQCVLELARSGADVRSVVSFHGLLTTQKKAEPGAVKAKLLVLTGAQDPYAPKTDVAGFEQEMTDAGGDWQVTVYGRGWHAFTDPNVSTEIPGVRYDALLDRLSWASATAFLEATLEKE